MRDNDVEDCMNTILIIGYVCICMYVLIGAKRRAEAVVNRSLKFSVYLLCELNSQYMCSFEREIPTRLTTTSIALLLWGELISYIYTSLLYDICGTEEQQEINVSRGHEWKRK